MRILMSVLLQMASLTLVAADLPKVAAGSIERIEQFSSRFVSARNVDVWLPPGYDHKQRYAVLYMHDGQMLFDADTTWNHQEWRVDEVASALLAEHKLRPFIVVGVWNNAKARHVEYFPQKPFESLSEEQRTALYAMQRSHDQALLARPVDSDNYLRFLVKELKPYIDSHYSVDSSPAGTLVMGSSMGGLISMYALLEYPDVFGAAACLSTHWPGSFEEENNPIPPAFAAYLQARLPAVERGRRLYFDHGTATLDAMYPALQEKMDGVMKARGYAAPQWQTRVFPGADHSEVAWAKRLEVPLSFLLATPPASTP